jgi:pimeloyl-ACP methyl ester carboxylesterase
MAQLQSNGLSFEYDTFGDRGARPLLLVMGLGAQMILWEEDFCRALADRGHFVVRFDNRDVGLSSKLTAAGVPNVFELMQKVTSGARPDVPYTLDDMADDTAGVLDALGLASAHVVGASMGGMIAQTVAVLHPQRVRSLTSIMSSTGDPSLPPAKPEAMAVLLSPPPSARDAAIEQGVRTWRTIGSPGFPFDEANVRKRAALAYDRCFHPEGTARQLAAILAHGSRRARLAHLKVPTLVIHGAADPLVPIEGGRDTAAAIPDAELLVIEGMGHDLPQGAWPQIVGAIARHTERAEKEHREHRG